MNRAAERRRKRRAERRNEALEYAAGLVVLGWVINKVVEGLG